VYIYNILHNEVASNLNMISLKEFIFQKFSYCFYSKEETH